MNRLICVAFLFLLIPGVFVACSPTAELKTVTFESALADVQAADITIEVPFQRVTVNALGTPDNLINGRAQVVGDLELSVDGDDVRRVVNLHEDTGNKSYAGDEEATWTVGLTTEIPLRLSYTMNAGTSALDLESLKLDYFSMTASAGEFNATLPAGDNGYDVDVDMSSGTGTLILPADFSTQMTVSTSSGTLQVVVGENTAGTVAVDMSSGDVTFTVPENSGLRVEMVDVATGTINVPETLDLIAGNEDANAIWESPDYEESDYQLVFSVSISAGSFTIQH